MSARRRPSQREPALSGSAPARRASGARPQLKKQTPPEPAEYSIDELARVAGSTVRNVRAYQDRGLLPPPERRGRAGVYTDVHLGRLRMIGKLLGRGFTLSNISELMSAWERGQDLSRVLGLEAALTRPWTDEAPAYFEGEEIAKMFGDALTPGALAKALELGLVESEGGRFRVASPRMLHAGAELVAAGVPMEALLDVLAEMRKNLEHIADDLVGMFTKHIVDRYGKDRLPPPSEAPGLADLVLRIRPLAKLAVDVEVSRALERSAGRFLGDRLSQVLDRMHAQRGEKPDPTR